VTAAVGDNAVHCVKAPLRILAVLALTSLAMSPPLASGGSPTYPLKRSANGRYLVDQNNAPVLIVGDSPQALMVNLATNEASVYFADRHALGFNSLWINLLCSTYTGGRTDASTIDGIVPFTGTIPSTSSYDLTKTNEAYFARVDQMINLAAQQEIQVLLDPCETGSFLSVMSVNGTNRCRAYGQFLGNRYKNFPNIIWMSGNDFQDWRNPSSDSVVRAVALGIRDNDTNHLHTAELDYTVSSSLDDTNWNAILGLNATYTYQPTYARLLQDYNRTNFLPNFMVEANYEFESLAGPVTTPPILRKQEYWTMTSGACGQLYGNHYTWPFASGWQGFLDTPGAIQFGYMKQFFEPRAWFNLVPDTNHIVVTAGFGTFSSTGFVATNDYLTAASALDGSLAVIYTPVIGQFMVDMSKLGAPAVARWYDPASGTFIPITGSPFTNSGTRSFTPPGPNSDGDGGWVLALETNPPPDPPPPPPKPQFVQQNYAVPQTPQAQVSAAYPFAQTASNANILAIGWNDVTASISGVTDSASNAYQIAIPTYRGNGLSQAIYFCPAIKPGTNTVTVTFNQPALYVDLRVMEYSGLAKTNAFDIAASASGSGASASSGAVNTRFASELLVGAGMTATTFTGAGSGFTQRVITAPDADIIEDRVTTATGTYSATAPLNSGAWLMQIAAFRTATSNPPQLRIFRTPTNAAVVAWPAATTGYTLQENSDLANTNWMTVTNEVQTADSDSQVIVTPSASQKYFRLRSP